MTARHWIRWNIAGELRRDQTGSLVIAAAAVLLIAMGIAALAVDMSYAYAVKTQLWATADAAALAAASDLPDEETATATALDYAEKNMPAAKNGPVVTAADVQAGFWDSAARSFTVGATPLNAVRVTARRSQVNGNPLSLIFANILGVAETNISTSSLAGTPGEAVCLLTLDPSAGNAMNIGNGVFTATNCKVQINSTDALALNGNSNGVLNASRICVGGAAGSTPSYSPPPETGCAPLPDPLADLETPTFGACDQVNATYNEVSVTIFPGVYCGGISVGSSTVLTMDPGLYVIKDGVFKVAGGGAVQGAGITLLLSGATTEIDLGGSGTLDLSPPVAGPLAGFLIAPDRNDPPGTNHSLGGGANVKIAGIIYLPEGNLVFQGNSEATTADSAVFFIVRTFEMNGSGSLTLSNNLAAANFPIPCALSGTCVALLQ